MPPIVQATLLFVFPALVIVAALRDVTTYTIPNWISGGLILAFVPAALALGLPLETIGLQFAIGVAALVAGMAMFALGWIGGGDAKLFAAAALWLGWPAAVTFLLATGVGGGALAMGLLSLRSSRARAFVPAGPAWFNRLATPGESVPYGVAIAVGALVAFPTSAVLKAFAGLG
ncbi:prepilin peptidase [Phenylobacterium sp.]|uniref:A24 family peptidase n=1 Tax=Phenylobacterium sp. TaxID=1871053 RepID=UPI00273698F9|nr:prepilin peptidase [Phenylobacterium sp.]MDP3855659.1 prepilin peptidase [Phenylobacterium sp.]